MLATYIFLAANTTINLDAFQWIPVVSFSAMIFIASCGALPVPYVIVAEILPDKVSFKFEYSLIFLDFGSFVYHKHFVLYFSFFAVDSWPWNDIVPMHIMDSYICYDKSFPNALNFDRITRLCLFLCRLLLCHRCLFARFCSGNQRKKPGRDFNDFKSKINGTVFSTQLYSNHEIIVIFFFMRINH